MEYIHAENAVIQAQLLCGGKATVNLNIDFLIFAWYFNKKYLYGISLPPGKELSVRLSIVRPLKIEGAGAIFMIIGVKIENMRKERAQK